jgi:hypothetical protein
MKRCKLCLRTVWDQYIGIPGRHLEPSGIYYHHHNGMRECYPYQVAEVDEDNPGQNYPVPVEPEPEKTAV